MECFKFHRLKAKTKMSFMLLRELLFANDYALTVYILIAEDLQSVVDNVRSRNGLIISIKKTEGRDLCLMTQSSRSMASS